MKKINFITKREKSYTVVKIGLKMVITYFLFLTEPLKVKIVLTRVKIRGILTCPF